MSRFLLLCLISAAAHAAPVTSVTLASGEWPPYLSEHLPGYGSASRIVDAAFALQGIKVEYQFFPWKRAYEEAREGRLDGTLIWAKYPAREADFLFSDEIVRTHVVLFYAKARPIHWQTLRDLAPYRIGGALGYYYGEEYSKLENEGVLKMELAASDEINLRKLAANHLDLTPVERDAGLYMLATSLHDIADQLAYDPRNLQTAAHYVLISKRSPHAEEILRRFNLGLAQLHAEGKFATPATTENALPSR
jgi:polar amino acid transport system substrate-binding protein